MLEVLDAIDRRGSFAKAAEELNKATSALSYSVQKLEEQLDIALFQRQGRRSVLTPAGRLVLEEGRNILNSTLRLASKAKEVATGWEPKISIAVESLYSYPTFFKVLSTFLDEYTTVEIDIFECVLNGGWEALERDRVDLIIGVPGPVPVQKGFRAVSLGENELIPVIAASHDRASIASDPKTLEGVLPKLRRIVTHDTSVDDIVRSAGLSDKGRIFYVQNIDQKTEAILAGIGIGHLPLARVRNLLDDGVLLKLSMGNATNPESFLAWRISNKGKGLQLLIKNILAAHH